MIKAGVQLIGTGGASVTILDASAATPRARVVETLSGSSLTLLQGFTITGGVAPTEVSNDVHGGGVYANGATISRNLITGNQARGTNGGAGNRPNLGGTAFGGGIYALSSVIVNNVIRNNTAVGGNAFFDQNGGSARGGGVSSSGAGASVTNNTFNVNTVTGGAGAGPGIAGVGSGGAFDTDFSTSGANNIFSNNTAAGSTTQGAVSGPVTFTNSLFFNNTPGGDGNTGLSPIFANPQFVSATDLHIPSTSPAKGAGTATGAPAVDLDGVTRPNPPGIGAYEPPLLPALYFTVTGPSSATSGTSFSEQVIARDNSGSTVTNYRGTVHFTSSDGAATLPVDYAFTSGDSGVHTFSVTLQTSGSQSVTATDTVTSTINGSANVGVVGPFGAPPNFSATATSTTQVTLMWSAVGGANHYEVARNSGAGFITIAMPTGFPSVVYVDTVSANTSYVYKVRAVDAASVASAYSNPDVATTVIFTEDPLIVRSTVVKAAHLTELRTAVNAIHLTAGLGPITVTDSSAAGVRIKAVHILELRSALDASRSMLGLTAITYTDSTLPAGTTIVKAVHFQQLRDGVK